MENIISGWLSSEKLVAPKRDNIYTIITRMRQIHNSEKRVKIYIENSLEQARKRTEKVYITDVAIQKVPYISIKT